MSVSKAYRAYYGAMARCLNPNDKSFHNYGGRGIKVCDSWRASFYNFVADMGMPPDPRAELHRKDNDGDYCPENCVWASRRTQQRNKQITHWIQFGNVRLCLADWADALNLPPNAIRHRLRQGFSTFRTLTTPLQKRTTFPTGKPSESGNRPPSRVLTGGILKANPGGAAVKIFQKGVDSNGECTP